MQTVTNHGRLRTVRLTIIKLTVFGGAAAALTWCSAEQAHAAVINITQAPYNAVGNGVTDNTAAINQALADANAASPKNSVFIPAGQFAHSGVINDNNVVLYGTGPSSVLVSTDPNNSCVFLKGNGPQLNTLKVTCPSANTRSNGAWEQIAVCPFGATNFQVRGVWVGDPTTKGCQGAGILTYGGNHGLITGNYVFNTLADGIHTTDGASYITVTNNTVTNVGDDMIAVVSYQQDGVVDSNIVITDNHCVSQTNGRGISVVGGNQVVIANNKIDESWATGIYIAGESSFTTFSPTNVTITNNVVNNANQSTSTLQGAMEIYSDFPASPAQNITVQGNLLSDRLNWGINIGSNTSNIVLENNLVPYHFNTLLTYPLIPRNATGSCLEAVGSGTSNGTAVKLDQQNGASNQKWTVTPLGGTNWEIEPSYASTLALDVAGGGTANGTLADLWTYSGATRQQWSVGFVNGGFSLTPLNATSKLLEVSGGGTANGTAIDINAPTGASSQAFSLDTGTQITAYPAAPSGLSATPASGTQVALSWTASPLATSYNIYRGTVSNSESVTPIATGITGTTYSDSGLSSGTTYYYFVSAVNSAGTSGYSNEAQATTSGAAAPAAPTGLSATPGNTQISLLWTASSGATSYNVYRGTSAGGESTTAIATGITGTTYTNTGLTNGTTYYYKVKAVNANGTSGYSNEASATPTAPAPPAAPTGLTATAGSAQVSLSWTASSGATSYNVYRGTTAGGESTTAIATGIAGTTYTNTGLTNGTTYFYKVKAVNANGTSGYSNEASATPAVAVPSAPTGLSASAGNAQIVLTWTASSGATSYNVYRGTTAGGESTTAIATGITGTTYTNTGLTNGTTYYYKVKAVNTSGTSGYSNEASATPSGTGGLLTGSSAGQSANVNLTTEGTVDWAKYAASSATSFDHKATGGTKLSNISVVGSGSAIQFSPTSYSMSWTDGTPTSSNTGSMSGSYITDAGNGFSFTAPADATTRTLKVYVKGFNTTGQLTAHLSDASATDYIATSSGIGSFYTCFTLTYKAASAGKTLTVQWVGNSGGGANVSILGATLQ